MRNFFSGMGCAMFSNVIMAPKILRDAQGKPLVDPFQKELLSYITFGGGAALYGLFSGSSFALGYAVGFSVMFAARTITNCHDVRSETCPPALQNFAGFRRT